MLPSPSPYSSPTGAFVVLWHIYVPFQACQANIKPICWSQHPHHTLMKFVFELRAVRINVLRHKFRLQKERKNFHTWIYLPTFLGGKCRFITSKQHTMFLFFSFHNSSLCMCRTIEYHYDYRLISSWTKICILHFFCAAISSGSISLHVKQGSCQHSYMDVYLRQNTNTQEAPLHSSKIFTQHL